MNWWSAFDISFWAAAVGAALVKVITSENHSFFRSTLTVAMAVFSSWAFTNPALEWLHLPPDTYKVPMAALLALTGEGVMRFLISIANDPSKGLEFWTKWRSGK